MLELSKFIGRVTCFAIGTTETLRLEKPDLWLLRESSEHVEEVPLRYCSNRLGLRLSADLSADCGDALI